MRSMRLGAAALSLGLASLLGCEVRNPHYRLRGRDGGPAGLHPWPSPEEASEPRDGAVAPGDGAASGAPDVSASRDLAAAGPEIGSGAAACAAPRDCAPGLACSAGRCTTLAADLVAFFRLDEGQGAQVGSTTGGSALSGTLRGATWSAAGFPAARAPNPACLSFDGIDDSVVLGTGGLPAYEAPKSVSLWFHVDPAPRSTEKMNLVVLSAGGALVQLGVYLGRVTLWTSSGGPVAPAGIPTAGWHHLVYTYDGAGAHVLHLDGARVASGSEALRRGPITAATLGTYPGDTNEFFRGRLDDLRIYARVLTGDEIASLAAGQ